MATRRAEKNDAQRALAALIRSDAERAAGTNDLVSKREAKTLDPFVREAEAEVRAEKPRYGRVTVDEVVDRAMGKAMATWQRFNPPENRRDAKYLSQAEVRQVGAVDPALGALTQRAYGIARDGGIAPGAQLRAQAERFLSQRGAGALLARRSGFGTEISARPGSAARAEVPPSVLEGFDAYYPAEAADLGATTLKTFRLGGQSLYAVHQGTDGDDGYVELFDQAGAPVLSARLDAGDLARVDPFFGLGRHAGPHGRRNVPFEEGLSEDPERLAAGQITSQWRPEAILRGGSIPHDGLSPTGFEPAGDLTPLQRELARFTIEVMYPRSLSIRAEGPGPIDLGRNADIAFGTHIDPRDGREYLVADYRDIDADAATFYFDRSNEGVLTLQRFANNG